MALLATKPKSAKPPKPKTIIYGKAGVGKTWASLDFPKVYYIDTEGGASLDHYTDKLEKSGGAYLGVEQGSTDLKVVLEQIRSLRTEEHDFKTLVVDSISTAFNNAILDEANRLEAAGIKNEFGLDKKPAIQMMRKIVSAIQKLDMNVILIAHEKQDYKEKDTVVLIPDVWDKAVYDLHMACHITKNGPNRFLTPVKSRLKNFPEDKPIPWSFEAFREKYEAEFGEGVLSREVESVVLAAPTSITQFKELAAKLAIDESAISKKLKKVKCESLQEVEESTLQEWISSLTSKLDDIQL